jgi:hypothetical protein
MSFSVTTLTAPRTALKETRFSSIEDALTSADFMLRSGASSVWIVDRVAQTGWIASSRPSLPLLGTCASPARFATGRRLAAASLH